MKVLGLFLILFCVKSLAVVNVDSLVRSKIERVGDMTHIEFSGLSTWDYRLEKKGDKELMLTLPRIDEDSYMLLKRHSGLLLKKIEFDSLQKNKTILKFILSDSKVENFDYLTQDPSRLVIDFYVSEVKILDRLKLANSSRLRGSHGDKKRIAKKHSKKKSSKLAKRPSMPKARAPAFAEFLFTDEDRGGKSLPSPEETIDLGTPGHINNLFDFSELDWQKSEDLEAKVIEAKGNIYLRFPMLNLPNRHLAELERFVPEYEIKQTKSDENKQARFLLQLFHSRAYASFIKGLRLFKGKFKDSKYSAILSYIEADVWIQLWKKDSKKEFFNRGIAIYKKMMERHPHSPITERTMIYAGMLLHSEGLYFDAAKYLQRYLNHYSDSPFANYAKIYLADTIARLNNFDGAIEEFEQVIKAGQEGPKVEAEMRIADVFFLEQDFRRAERRYRRSIASYPEEVKKYPNVWYNLAEAQFNLAEYGDALKNYKRFFGLFPRHNYSAKALTRIGELIDILSNDRSRAQGFYNESFFRFRRETGGVVSRMRSLSQRFKGMSEKKLKDTIREIRALEREINLPQVKEFTAFMISDGYYWRGDFNKAADTLISYFQEEPRPVNMNKFEKRISRAIAGEIRKQLENGKSVQALELIESHQKSWLSKSRRVDVQYFRAQCIENIGLSEDAFASYSRLLERMNQLVGSKEERERKIFEYYPSFESLHLRLASTSLEKDPLVAEKHMAKIVNSEQFSPADKHKFYLLKSKLAFSKKNYALALKQVEEAKKFPVADKEKRDKFQVYRSEVYEKNGRFDEALALLENYYEEGKSKGDRDQIFILSKLFKIYREKGLMEKAVKTGEMLLADYGEKYNLDRERYHLGEIHYNNKNRDKAKRVWKDLTKKTVWADLARNKQENEDWQKSAESSLKRIPAMSQ